MTYEEERAAVAAIEATLRPCPHCGPMPAKPELVRCDTSRRWQVFCGPCGSSSGSSREPQAAADHWNSRHVGGPEIGATSAASTDLALFVSNLLADLSYSDAAPIFGFASRDRQDRAYAISGAIIQHVNQLLRNSDNITETKTPE